MSEKTIHETEAAYSEKAAGIVRGWYEAQDEISRSSAPVEGPHAHLLTGAQRAEAAREQTAERARAEAEGYRREYLELTEERNDAIRARTRSLRRRLFNVAGTPGEAMLPNASNATEEELAGMLEDAILTGSSDQARAVFAVAHRRQSPEVLAAYFDRADPEARELYQEWRAARDTYTEDAMTRKLADAETMFSPPDSSHFAPASTFHA